MTRRQSTACVNGNGGLRLSGMNAIPAHVAYDLIDSLPTNSGEPMT